MPRDCKASRMPARTFAPALALVALLAATATADVVPIDPFVGDHTDTFNRFSSTQAVQTLPVFDDTATLNNLTSGGAIKVELGSSLSGDLVLPRSGWMAGQLGIGQWLFDQPAVRFGGYFENNSGQDDATVEFFDDQGALLATVTASIPVDGGTWVWNGWESDVPFHEVKVTGNGLLNGFIWYEDMEVTYVPEPGSALLLIVAAAIRPRRF